MSALDLETFQDTFRAARSMAVVGNAESVLEWPSGELIDGHDLVVRFNRAYTEGVEDRVGRRTDILVANRTYSLRKAPSPAATLKPRCVLCFLEPDHEIDYAAFNEWTSGLPTLITLAPDLAPVGQFRRTRPVTMGTNALYTLLRLFRIERLFLTGFTFYGAAPGSHGVYCGPERKARGMWHDLEDEAAIFARVIAGYQGELKATPEVAGLLSRYGAGAAAGEDAGGALGVEDWYARLGWRLIRWGTRLRQRAESSGRTGLTSPKKKSPAAAR
ncbi:MAG: glycosyltransferase family 29 protein [Geminicoccaceae bacterium]